MGRGGGGGGWGVISAQGRPLPCFCMEGSWGHGTTALGWRGGGTTYLAHAGRYKALEGKENEQDAIACQDAHADDVQQNGEDHDDGHGPQETEHTVLRRWGGGEVGVERGGRGVGARDNRHRGGNALPGGKTCARYIEVPARERGQRARVT